MNGQMTETGRWGVWINFKYPGLEAENTSTTYRRISRRSKRPAMSTGVQRRLLKVNGYISEREDIC